MYIVYTVYTLYRMIFDLLIGTVSINIYVIQINNHHEKKNSSGRTSCSTYYIQSYITFT